MKNIKDLLPRAMMLLLLFTLICGVAYTGIVTGAAQLLFPEKANGSIITVDGKKYGSALLAQQYTSNTHLWGRVMQLDTITFTDANGKRLLYAAPSNDSPASEEYRTLIAQRTAKIRAANPEMQGSAVPVDLVTSSGSGLDPHISKAAALYQTARLSVARNQPEAEIIAVIEQCTSGRFLGIFGEERVNVLQVNLMLDGIL
ncbi:MAG: potassium-transporting ATPase subunit C [Ruthenibacterium sp.]